MVNSIVDVYSIRYECRCVLAFFLYSHHIFPQDIFLSLSFFISADFGLAQNADRRAFKTH